MVKILFIVNDFLFEPLGIMSLAAVLKKNKHVVELLKINAKYKEYGSATNEEDMFDFVEKFSPDIILYSITTGMHKHYSAINKKLKEKFDFLSVFGGMHASFFPDFIHEDYVDVIENLLDKRLTVTQVLEKLGFKKEDFIKIKDENIKSIVKDYEIRNFLISRKIFDSIKF